jgi:hypothetical protein
VFLAASDDRTDVDLHRALPPGAITLHVSSVHPFYHAARRAPRYTVDSPNAVQELLRDLADQPDCAPAAAAG